MVSQGFWARIMDQGKPKAWYTEIVESTVVSSKTTYSMILKLESGSSVWQVQSEKYTGLALTGLLYV